jgi:sialate O-acetylesterase
VTVEIQGQKATATAGQDGKWLVRLDKLKAGGPFEMTITGKSTVTLKNVLVGEVWVCSGQSNMWWPITMTANSKEAIGNSTNPMLRLYTVPQRVAGTPKTALGESWVECGPKTVATFSAVAYYFGRDLQKARDVPVGLIHTSWGGTRAEAWTTRPVIESLGEYRAEMRAANRDLENYAWALLDYQYEMGRYNQLAAAAKKKGLKPPDAPKAPMHPAANPNHGFSGLYNAMIAPLQPYAISGAIWYQGESNAGQAFQYRTLFPAMIKSWRSTWGQGDFPFLFVQLAPFMKIEKEPIESAWAELRDAQLHTALTVPKTGMAVITDVGDPADIHPQKKEPVGARLALAARALAYGEKIEYSGPTYDRMKVENGKVVLSFKHVGGGLVAKDGPLQGFTIAGEDRKWVNADAEVQGDQVIVKSDKVTDPVAVRYGWTNCPVVNLWNKAGLPASPFRTDNFPMITQPKTPTAVSRQR